MNVDKIEKLIRVLESNPESYDQTCWAFKEKGARCTTAACLAGHTVAMEKYKLIFDGKMVNGRIAVNCSKDGFTYSIALAARQILGLGQVDAAVLFDAMGNCWRHHNEFIRSHPEDQVQVAIKELRDLIRLGPYSRSYSQEEVTIEPSEDVVRTDEACAEGVGVLS